MNVSVSAAIVLRLVALVVFVLVAAGQAAFGMTPDEEIAAGLAILTAGFIAP